MTIEIGSLVVRGSFGQSAPQENRLSEEQLDAVMEELRREFRDILGREIAASEQRIKEGMF